MPPVWGCTTSGSMWRLLLNGWSDAGLRGSDTRPGAFDRVEEPKMMMTSTVAFWRCVPLVCMMACIAGCGAARHRTTPVVAEKHADAANDAESSSDDDAGDTEEKYQVEATKNVRKLAKLERDQDIVVERLAKARMSQSHAATDQKTALAGAEQELDLETARMQKFSKREVPNRIAWAELRLTQAQDRVKDSEEELHQLELMYAEEDFADQTKEIVLDRSRRRLERSHRDLELRHEDHAILTEKTIPLELAEREQKVRQKELALDKAHRDAEASKADKRISLMSAEAEIVKVGVEIEALKEEMERDRKKHEEEISETKT